MKIYWIDLFCGAGGTSSGIHFSNTNTEVLACVNHDVNAIASHKANHPNALHFTEDIRDFKVVAKLKKIVQELRLKQPNCIINLWASLECTNFSNAKGGQQRDADSRSLAEHMYMYLEAINPNYFWVENVREFMSWGPLCENKKPISKLAGRDFVKWMEKVESFGYISEKKILNAADFGACQKRKRLFIQFAKPDLGISWAKPTHSESCNDGLIKWNPVKKALDFNIEGKSIFQRKKPLSTNTIKRILAGCKKFIAKGENGFTKQYNSGNDFQRVKSFNEPIGTVTTNNRFAVVTTHLNTYYGKSGLHSIDSPSPTITTNDRIAKIDAFILNPSWFGNSGSINKPCCTIVARQDKAPLYLITSEKGNLQAPIYDVDCENTIELKKFMLKHNISDIKLRMLVIPELKKIQGFPDNYILIGNQKEQKKQIGNAVEVNQAKALVEDNYNSLYKKLVA
ncbi:DNA cytosine methyltransferase [Flavobacterium jejuense]|nr:DNA (cytosine-5-)-methyltransferase [Flavobacterium jejuense]